MAVDSPDGKGTPAFGGLRMASGEFMKKLSERATILYEKGDYEDARILWKEVLKNDPGDTRAATGYRLATMLCEKWSPLGPRTDDRASSGADEIESLLAAGKVADAVSAARSLLTDHPNDPRAQDAYGAATRAMRVEPVVRVLAKRANEALDAGRLEEARNFYREILLSDDQNLEALDRLRLLDRATPVAPLHEVRWPAAPIAPPSLQAETRTPAGTAWAAETPPLVPPTPVATVSMAAAPAPEEIVELIEPVEGPLPLATREYVEPPRVGEGDVLAGSGEVVDLVELVKSSMGASPEEIVDLVELIEVPALASREIVDLVDLVEEPPGTPSAPARKVMQVMTSAPDREEGAPHVPLDLTTLDDEIGDVMSIPDPETQQGDAEPGDPGKGIATGPEPAAGAPTPSPPERRESLPSDS